MTDAPAPRRGSTPRSVLFLGHDAYRAGAQMVLLSVVRHLRALGAVEPVICLREGGELLAEYQRLGRTVVLAEPEAPPDGLRRRWLGTRFRREPRGLVAGLPHRLDRLRGLRVDAVLANSVATLELAARVHEVMGAPVLSYVHELEIGLRRWCGDEVFAQAAPSVDLFAAASGAVVELLASRGVARERIRLVYEGIELPPPDPGGDDGWRLRLGIPPHALVVGACGTLEWRKAPEIFLLVAAGVARVLGPAAPHFVWVGGEEHARVREALAHDVRRLGLEGRVHFTGVLARPLPVFTLFDAFLLTSREDPFPLVCLEAAALGVPTVCFAGGGGMAEFVRDDAGVVVPYLDVVAAADALVGLLGDRARRQKLGETARTRVRAAHDSRLVAGQLAGILDELVSGRARPGPGTGGG